MSVEAVAKAIDHCRAVIAEWPECMSEFSMGWREVDTRYAFIDPVLTALGWNVSDPKQVVAEWRRGEGWLDYALFATDGRATILEGGAPIIAVEAKSLWGHWHGSLAEHESQLEYYVTASPAMQQGLGVLTNGAEWHIYDVAKPGEFAEKLVAKVDITEEGSEDVARELYQWLSKERWW